MSQLCEVCGHTPTSHKHGPCPCGCKWYENQSPDDLPEAVLHDCPSAELVAFLKKAPKPPFDSGYKKAMLNYALECARWHAGLENVLARAAIKNNGGSQ